jgi:outer membrane protein insertion porin family
LTSSIGYTLLYDDRDNRIRPTRGQSFGISQDFAGLGGDVKYVKTRINADKFWKPFGNFVFGLSLEGGYIHPLEDRGLTSEGIDDVRLTDRFYLGEPQMRGFDIRGVGPRVQRVFFEGQVVNGVAVNAPLLAGVSIILAVPNCKFRSAVAQESWAYVHPCSLTWVLCLM